MERHTNRQTDRQRGRKKERERDGEGGGGERERVGSLKRESIAWLIGDETGRQNNEHDHHCKHGGSMEE